MNDKCWLSFDAGFEADLAALLGGIFQKYFRLEWDPIFLCLGWMG